MHACGVHISKHTAISLPRTLQKEERRWLDSSPLETRILSLKKGRLHSIQSFLDYNN